MTKEEYKKEIVRMWDSLRTDSENKGYYGCVDVICKKCPLKDIRCSKPINAFKVIEAVEKWAKENPKPKYKVSQIEYDILKSFKESNLYSKFYFESSLVTRNLLKLGYFEGADENMKIKDYFDNCEVVEDD